MDKTTQFQQSLMTDANARKEFSADPSGYMHKHGIAVPAGANMPASIPLHELEDAVDTVKKSIGSTDLHKVATDPAAVSKLVEHAFPAKAAPGNLANIQRMMKPGVDAAQESIAVVVAVVAVKVGVY